MRALTNTTLVIAALAGTLVLAACEDDVGQQFGMNSSSGTSGTPGSTSSSSGMASPGTPGGMPGGDDSGTPTVKFTVYVKDLILNETKRDNLSKPEAELLAPSDTEDGSVFDAAFFSP